MNFIYSAEVQFFLISPLSFVVIPLTDLCSVVIFIVSISVGAVVTVLASGSGAGVLAGTGVCVSAMSFTSTLTTSFFVVFFLPVLYTTFAVTVVFPFFTDDKSKANTRVHAQKYFPAFFINNQRLKYTPVSIQACKNILYPHLCH